MVSSPLRQMDITYRVTGRAGNSSEFGQCCLIGNCGYCLNVPDFVHCQNVSGDKILSVHVLTLKSRATNMQVHILGGTLGP